jgi:hypothetical protein
LPFLSRIQSEDMKLVTEQGTEGVREEEPSHNSRKIGNGSP